MCTSEDPERIFTINTRKIQSTVRFEARPWARLWLALIIRQCTVMKWGRCAAVPLKTQPELLVAVRKHDEFR